MSEENKHMDDAFQKMGEDFKVTYSPAFWFEMESQLNDTSMDDAFKTAAASSFVVPDMPDIGDIGATLDDAFMDDAFKNAASQQQAAYTASYFADFKTQEADLQMNDAFTEASNSSVADYSPKFWPDADNALQNEGLHYEYNSSYWTEAKSLLDLADRRQFFTRWSAAATILLLLSFFSLNGIDFETPIAEAGQQNAIDTKSFDNQSSDEFISQSDANYSELISAFDADYNAKVVDDNIAHNINANDVAYIGANDNGLNDVAVNNNNGNNNDSGNNDNANNLANNAANNNGSAGNDQNNSPAIADNDNSNGGGFMMDLSVDDEAPMKDLDFANNGNITKERSYGGGLTKIQNRFIHHDVIEKKRQEELALAEEEMNNDDNDIQLLPSSIIDHQLSRYNLPAAVDLQKYKPRPSHTLAVYGGAGIGREYGANYLEASRRFNGGVEYMHGSFGKLKRFEFGISGGLNYVRQTNLSIFRSLEGEIGASDNDLMGDEYRSWYRMAYTDMFHANVMLRVNYKIALKHKFLFGFGYEQAVALQTNRVGENFNNHKGLATENDVWTVTEGINNDFRFSFGYQYDISKRLSANLTGNLGVKDRTDDLHFGNNVMDQEYNLMLGFKYNLIRR